MRSGIKVAVTILSTAGILALSGPALATNGYFTHGVGTESKGMAGTGVGSDAEHGSIIAASAALIVSGMGKQKSACTV